MSLLITTKKPNDRLNADAFIFGVFRGEPVDRHPFAQVLTPASRRYLRTFVQRGFFGENGEVDYVVFPHGRPQAAFLIGLGKRSEWTRRRFVLCMRRLVSVAASQKVRSLAVHLPSLRVPDEQDDSRCVRLAAENLLLADYRFNTYRKELRAERAGRLQSVMLVSDAVGAPAALRTAQLVAQYVNTCRDLANTPAGHMTPKAFAAQARILAKESGCTIRVLGRPEMKKEKMSAVLGVAQGSSNEPQFVIMEYRGGPKGQAPIVFVGKGVTFDSGGINLKPSSSMGDMHMDMSGGAAVIAATAAIARLRLPVNVITLVPAAENMPSGSGYHPGDVLISRSGTTIEIVDTDAEGRVILADALDFAKQYKPQLVVDVATLTGAAMVALGQRTIALFTSDHRLAEQIEQLGETSGDYVWHLPMDEEYESEIKGTVGDIANIGKVRYGGAIHGALFLKHFAGKYPWVHLDIAPTMTSAEGQFLAKGATGTAVRLLVAMAEQRSKVKS